jgi:hypothetical protein
VVMLSPANHGPPHDRQSGYSDLRRLPCDQPSTALSSLQPEPCSNSILKKIEHIIGLLYLSGEHHHSTLAAGLEDHASG